ncbi:SusD/RagB family nutrient-binding outer membrane lipoprotein [Chitinophaga sp. Ak27]|uniref:SusD/RagB family nutrient-binding outer membrane lipoprotein n=1 Tax=Chitinophaga sp. Ak27 TaxID=2726116 RepID=UPI00145F4E09|nr:SusD/RagB family nutrient-binding outer membrane lipoprotein [Chitinophaga sp. Ak27]NLU90487.1 SusD/RagB family nutrient-binding outer membrane lipoprotein [Chitinophaga sp. Ak27]
MKNIKKYTIFSLLVLMGLSQSCKKKMIELNTDPNLIADVAPEFWFTGVTTDLNYGSRDQISQRYGTTMKYMQYIVPEGVSADGLIGQYWKPSAVKGPNPGLPYYGEYYNIGRDMHRIINRIDLYDAATKAKYLGLRAICQIMDTYYAWKVADVFGALPYYQAFNISKYPLPAYDYNWTLYKTFDSTLKAAATVLRDNATSQIALGNQDLFYGGDYTKWYALANTLRIKIAQRFERRDAANFTAVINDVSSAFGGNIISSNAGSFVINFTRDWSNNVDDINVILFNYNASFPFVEHLKATNDPRMGFMVRQNDFGTNCTQYVKVQNEGNATSQAALQLPENQVRYWGKHPTPFSAQNTAYGSTGGDRYKTFALQGTATQNLGFLSAIQSRLFVKNGGFGGFNSLSSTSLMHTDETSVSGSTIKMKYFEVSYAETCFMMAEIAAKGSSSVMGKTAEQWYRLGVQASFDQYKEIAINTNVPNAASISDGGFASSIPYLGLPSIYTQAWVHFLMQPEEAWAMWKRTGYPQFTDVRPGNNGLVGTSSIAYLENLWDGGQNLLLPRRNSFDRSSNLNDPNYNAAVSTMISKDAAYGSTSVDTKGRIWWDN